MQILRARLGTSPVSPRVVPFLVFVGLTMFQGQLGAASPYWVYALKTLVGAWLVWVTWPLVSELKWAFSGAAVATGVGVFVLWIGLDGWYPGIDELTRRGLCPLLRGVGLDSWCDREVTVDPPWNPHAQFGAGSVLAWSFIGIRLVGSTLVVPPVEEVFYRSFLYRYLMKAEFQAVALGAFAWMPFVVTSVVFGLAHREWLAGILCGFAYQGLVCWKKRLGDAMTAHAITNLLLGLWVVRKDAWHFW